MSKILLGHAWGYSHFAPYLINDDPTGLTEEEIREANEFCQKVKREYGDDALIVDAGNEEDKDFGYPEYGGKRGEVVPYTIHHTKEDLYVVGKR